MRICAVLLGGSMVALVLVGGCGGDEDPPRGNGSSGSGGDVASGGRGGRGGGGSGGTSVGGGVATGGSQVDHGGEAGGGAVTGGNGGKGGDNTGEAGDSAVAGGGASGNGDAGASGNDAGGAAGGPSQARYLHTIAIDGVNDFTADETFITTSATYTSYVTWDEANLYLGMSGSDLGANSLKKWVSVYLGGTPGTAAGFNYNTQQPTLPFSAKWHVRWRTDGGITEAQAWNGSSWSSANWSLGSNVSHNGTFWEMRIKLSDIGSPATANVVFNLLDETVANEATYAGTPSSAFTDGYDPNIVKYFAFAVTGPAVPNAAVARP